MNYLRIKKEVAELIKLELEKLPDGPDGAKGKAKPKAHLQKAVNKAAKRDRLSM